VTPRNQPTARLGVFDSGLGGLTVVRALIHRPVHGRIVYFGDTARVPYGNKSPATVTRLTLEAMRFLQHQGVRALVVACNTASAVAMDALVREASVPVLGVVEAGARSAAKATRTGRVGVIGTRATVGSRCYERALERLRPGLAVSAAACPLFVPLVEEGWIDGDVTRRIAEEYLGPVRDAGVDTLVLGCTHYPLLRAVIQDVIGKDVTLIDSGEAVAEEVESLLRTLGVGPSPESAAIRHRFYVSDQIERFEVEMRRFLGETVAADVRTVDQTDVPWYDRTAGDPVPEERIQS
jgi:glutamate racemase